MVLKLSQANEQNFTVVINDLKGKIVLYDSKGNFVQEVLLGESVNVEKDVQVQFSDFITSTGLQIKSDPGINVVYSSFLLLMISICVSFFTYSQIWFVESKDKLTVGKIKPCRVIFSPTRISQTDKEVREDTCIKLNNFTSVPIYSVRKWF